MGRYTIHQTPDEEIPPLSRTAARKLEHPPGTFAAYHPDLLLTPGVATLPHWDSAALAAETAIKEFEKLHGESASRIGWVLQRSESVGSSTIEDVNPSLRRVARAEAIAQDGGDPHDETAKEAIGSVAATRLAAELGEAPGPIALDDLLAIHAALMDHTTTPELGGRLRQRWVRIGGVLGGYPPPAYVAPPAEEVPRLLDDLLAYINDANHHPITAAAVAHAQFESIHPFSDGNGRAGRALVQTILRKRGVTRYTTPPISALLALSQDDYIEALTATRYEGPANSPRREESLDSWVSLFTSTAEASCDHAERLIGRIDAATRHWETKLNSRRGSAARKIVERLPEIPVFTVQSMSDRSGIPLKTVYRAVNKLADVGIVAPVQGKHRGRDLYEAPDILDVFKDSTASAGDLDLSVDGTARKQTSRAEMKKEKGAEAVSLRQQGLTHREIGETLGMSTSWAQAVTKGVPRSGQHRRASR